MSAIITRDTQSYASQFVFAVKIMLGCAVLCTLSAYCGEVLRLRWRRRIVHAIQNKHFPTCYGMNNLPPDQMDNTDQRITEAVQDFTSTFGSLFICSFPAGVGGGVQNTFLYVVTSGRLQPKHAHDQHGVCSFQQFSDGGLVQAHRGIDVHPKRSRRRLPFCTRPDPGLL